MSVSDRLHEKARGVRDLARFTEGIQDPRITEARIEQAYLLDLLADCYEALTTLGAAPELRARIEEVSR